MLNMADNNSFFDLFSAYLKTINHLNLKLILSFDGMFTVSLRIRFFIEILNFYPCDHGSVMAEGSAWSRANFHWLCTCKSCTHFHRFLQERWQDVRFKSSCLNFFWVVVTASSLSLAVTRMSK